MRIRYQHGYYPEKELEVIAIFPKHEKGLNFHVLLCADGTEVEATQFTYASGCMVRASLADNW